VEINLKENIYLKTYDNKIQLNEEIVDFILSDKINTVLFKGDPTQINYKLIKKVLPLNKISNTPEIVREKYQNILDYCDKPNICMIYKK